MAWLAIGLLLALPAISVAAPVAVTDGLGRRVELAAPAKRVVTLAPSITEVAYAVGSGDRVVGVSAWSDWPPQAAAKPVVASAAGLEWERLAALAPDLAIAWRDGFRESDIARLEALGAKVFVANARSLADIGPLLGDVARLTGGDAAGAVSAYEGQLARIRARHASLPRVGVFLEVSHKPLLTAGGRHFLSEAMAACGADNVYADRAEPAPAVSWEDLHARDPAAIIGTGMRADGEGPFRAAWSARAGLRAVREGRLAYVGSAALGRPSPRIVEGIDALCRTIDRVR